MLVTTVKATIRMSRQVDTRTWATVELGAEGTLSPDEVWEEAQALLYDDLKIQLSNLWKASKDDTSDPSIPSQAQAQAPPAQPAIASGTGEILECPEHRKSAESSKGGGLYCPTKLPEGSKPKYCPWTYGKAERRPRSRTA